MKLYAYNEQETGGAHAIVIELPFDQAQKYHDQRVRERDLGTHALGEWVEVVDVLGTRWQVRTHPCGAGCRCAAQARPSREAA